MLEKEIKKWQDLSISLGNSIGSGMPSSHNSGNAKYTKAIEILSDLEKEYLLEIGQIRNSLKTTERVIMSVERPNRREVLRLRYIQGLPVQEIAAELSVSEGYIYKLQRKSLTEIANKSNELQE